MNIRFFAKEASDSAFDGKNAILLAADRNSPRELLGIFAENRKQGAPKSWFSIFEDNGNYYCHLEVDSFSYCAHD